MFVFFYRELSWLCFVMPCLYVSFLTGSVFLSLSLSLFLFSFVVVCAFGVVSVESTVQYSLFLFFLSLSIWYKLRWGSLFCLFFSPGFNIQSRGEEEFAVNRAGTKYRCK